MPHWLDLGYDLSHALPLAYLAIFLGGVATSLTPCVYPVIPITVGFIGASSTSGGSRTRSLLLSASYVLGLALTYAALGVFAALTGTLFGEWSADPWAQVLVANVCLLFGLSLLGAIKLPSWDTLGAILQGPKPLPELAAVGAPGRARAAARMTAPLVQQLNARVTGPLVLAMNRRIQRRGLISAFLVGAVSGVVIGPCTTPVLGVVLTFVGAHHDPVFGFTLMFTFALGMGLLLLLAGTFAGLLSALPRSGPWMVRIQRTFGWGMVILGEYFLVNAGKLFP